MMFLLMKISKIQLGSGIARPIMCLFLGLVSLVIVSLIGHHQLKKLANGSNYDHSSSGSGRVAMNPEQMDRVVRDILLNNFTGSNFIKHFSDLSKTEHLSGTEDNQKVAEFIRKSWMEQGLQAVHFAKYDKVLLNNPVNPSPIEVFDDFGKVHHRIDSILNNAPNSKQKRSKGDFAFDASSTGDTVKGLPVYVNYGRAEDYETLYKLGINVNGKIAIAKYGLIKSMDKAIEAQKRNVIGLILYSDPTLSVNKSVSRTANFKADSLNLFRHFGDPLTPLYPALKYVVREYDEKYLLEHELIPSIPVQAVGIRDAWYLLRTMGDQKVLEHFQNSFNFSYRYDPGFQKRRQFIRMPVQTVPQRKTIQNVVGYIEGKEESDRYVIVGHRYDDSFHGATGSNYGTSVMLEMSRVFMTAINETGWHPKRTIVFCAWDSQAGLTEWIEEFKTILEQRVIAYLNMNSVTGSEALWIESNPSLIRAATNSAKTILNASLDEIVTSDRRIVQVHSGIPEVSSPGMGNEHAEFLSYLGIPVVSFGFYNKSKARPLISPANETQLTAHITVGQFWAHLTHSLVDSVLVPLNLTDYSYFILEYINDLNMNLNDSARIDSDAFVQIQNLQLAAKRFLTETVKFHSFALEIELNWLIFERLNSRLTHLERCFISPKLNPNNWISRHVIYGYTTMNFASEFNAIYNEYEILKQSKHKEEVASSLKKIKLLISDVHHSLECAIQLLRKLPV